MFGIPYPLYVSRYYFGWLVTEGSAVLAGFGYAPDTKSWTGVSNIDVLGFELANNISNAAKAWNQVRVRVPEVRV